MKTIHEPKPEEGFRLKDIVVDGTEAVIMALAGGKILIVINNTAAIVDHKEMTEKLAKVELRP